MLRWPNFHPSQTYLCALWNALSTSKSPYALSILLGHSLQCLSLLKTWRSLIRCFLLLQLSTAVSILPLGCKCLKAGQRVEVFLFLASTASSKPFLALFYTKNKANNKKNLKTGSSEVYALGLYHLLPLLLIITF